MAILAPDKNITYLLNRLIDEGHAAFLVGGCVRDALTGRPVYDWDVASSAMPIEVARIFPKTVSTGERFGTVTVILGEVAVEVTTFRAESGYNDSRHPDSVEFVSSLEEDLKRRDFTINAMAVTVEGELIDPFGGMGDIERRIIRCVGDPNTRFSEDALRMFRAFRFSAALGFSIEKETLQAVYASAGRAKHISAERICAELEKTIMTRKPEIAGEMIKAGLLSRFVKSTDKSPGGLESISRLPLEPALRWSAFCAVLLDERLIASATGFLHDMRLDGKTIKACSRALSIPAIPEDSIGIKRLMALHGVEAVRCAAAAIDSLERRGDGLSELREESEQSSCLARVAGIISCGECFSLNKLAVTGSDLIARGHPPGPNLGETLDRLLDHVIEHPESNTREVLLKLAVICCRD